MMFTSDLRKIREKRGLTLEGLHQETKIPLSVLEEFEETGLFDNPMFNRVYLRSLVRTYAAYIDIPTKTMLEALDEALLDTYQGSLSNLYLREAPTEPEAVPAPGGPSEAAADEEEEQPAPEDAAASETATTVEKAAPQTRDTRQAAKETPDKGADAPRAEPVPRADEGARSTTTAVPVEGPSRARTHPPLLTTAEATREAPSLGPKGRRQQPVDVKRRAWYTHWMVIVVAVIGFAGAIWIVLVLLDRPNETASRHVATVDTTAVDTSAVEAVAAPPRPTITLDDTLYVVVLTTGKVERIMIRRDDDLRRPYWIEEGVAKAFPALDRIVFENRLDLIRLFVEGFEYPTRLRNEDGHLVITRQELQAFADTLTASPVQLPAFPDTIPLYPVRGR